MGVGVNNNLIPPVKGEVRNPKGKPKGTKHISTWIQEMLNDPEFETVLLDANKGAVPFKGAPLEAIIKVATHRAIHDKEKGSVWAEWLAKHGYGTKTLVEVTDSRKEILNRYGLPSEGDNVGETEEAKGGSSKDSE